MTTQKTFLIRATNGHEAVLRLPVNRYGGITQRGFNAVRARFYDGTEGKTHGLQYALNLEAFTDSNALLEAIKKYQRNEL